MSNPTIRSAMLAALEFRIDPNDECHVQSRQRGQIAWQSLNLYKDTIAAQSVLTSLQEEQNVSGQRVLR